MGIGSPFVATTQSAMTHSAIGPGSSLCCYRLLEKISEGGMGEIWSAKHNRLQRPAAVKLVRGDRLRRQAKGRLRELRSRFELEAQSTAVLSSPHTVDLYDFGVAGNGDYYYVMELLDGLDLQSLVKRFGAVPAERAVHLLIQTCDSLADAHFRGMVHRDIKPANIFTCRMGPTVDFVKVLDFGLVKPFAEPAERGAELTADDVVAGTPGFMAPELLEGGEAAPTTDLYALGCVAYWLLTGTQVFEGATPIKVALEHLRAVPDPPSVRSELDIPPSLEAVVLQCLEKDPAQRPASAEEFARVLDAVALPASWGQDRARAWWDLHMPPRIVQSS